MKTKKEEKKLKLWWFSKTGKITLRVILWIIIWFFFIIWVFTSRITYLQWNGIYNIDSDYPNIPEIIFNLSERWQQKFGIKVPCEINITESTPEEIAKYQKIQNRWSIYKQLWFGWLYRCENQTVSDDELSNYLWMESYNSIVIDPNFTWADIDYDRGNIVRIPESSPYFKYVCDNIVHTDKWTKCESYTTHDLKLEFNNTKWNPFFMVLAYDKDYNKIWQPKPVEYNNALQPYYLNKIESNNGKVCIILTTNSPITNYYKSLYDPNCEIMSIQRNTSHEELILAHFATNWVLDKNLPHNITITPIEITIRNPEL